MTSEVLRYAAFTDAGHGGNPAGVVLDAGSLGDAELLAIDRYVGYSETAFVSPTETATLRVRYFSPLAEVAFCGHATVASAVALVRAASCS
jgi:PhzF family phenazine biosynthesis protein